MHKHVKPLFFIEWEADFNKNGRLKQLIFHRKFDPKSRSKRRCSNHRKIIADAERHRRTPWTPADESKSIRGKKSADIGDTGEKKKSKNMPKSSKYHLNGNQNSIPNRWKIEVAFLERF